MITPSGHRPQRAGHAVLLATSVPLFLGALLADWAYSSTYVVQWINFASWLNAGALVIAGAALAWSLVSLVRGPAIKRDHGAWLYVGLVAAVFVVGFVTAMIHAKDAWAAMPAALILSVVVFLLALAASWAGLKTEKREAAQ